MGIHFHLNLIYPWIWILFKCIQIRIWLLSKGMWTQFQLLLNLMSMYPDTDLDTAKVTVSGYFLDTDTVLPNSNTKQYNTTHLVLLMLSEGRLTCRYSSISACRMSCLCGLVARRYARYASRLLVVS